MWKNKPIKPLPFPIYGMALSVLTFLGLLDSVYLMVIHRRVYTDIGYKSFCALSKAINCDTVSQSPYSILIGAPVAFWGLIGYIGFGLLLLLAFQKDAEKKRVWGLLILTAWIFSAVSLMLGYISTRFIQSYCILCIASYSINFMLLFFSWLIRRRFDHVSFIKGLILDMTFVGAKHRIVAPCAVLFIIFTIAAAMAYPAYWNLEMPRLIASVHRGVTDEGHPWIGAEQPELIIEEFSDYMCFQCKKMHFMLRNLVNLYPNRIRLIHRHFPMDDKINPLVKEQFHVGSAKLALFAIYALGKGKFWEINDLLFDKARGRNGITITEIASLGGLNAKQMAAECVQEKTISVLWNDILSGLRMGITGTPGYIIDGRAYLGEIPNEILGPFLR